MLVFVIIIARLFHAAVAQYWPVSLNYCYDNSMDRYYRELGCKPVFHSRYYCPLKYDCSELDNVPKGQCRAVGMYFSDGDKLEGSQLRLPCRHCFCDVREGEPKWICAVVDCFWPGKIGAGCHQIYEKGNCCPSGVLCENTPLSPYTHTCKVDNVTYLEGHVFHPPGQPCKTCTCQRGFDGTFGSPWCEDTLCGTELSYLEEIRKGCAPVFYGQDGCCPTSFRCPSPKDVVIRASGYCAYVYAQCVFGKLRLNINDRLSPGDNKCVTCSCFVPPYMTCTFNPTCQYG